MLIKPTEIEYKFRIKVFHNVIVKAASYKEALAKASMAWLDCKDEYEGMEYELVEEIHD